MPTIEKMNAALNGFVSLSRLAEQLKRGVPLTADEAALEQLTRLAYVNGCPVGVPILNWLLENGYVKYALTSKAIVELMKGSE